MSTYKLQYFNFRGRGEICRLVFAAAGQKYEDVRLEREQWPALKRQMPLGQVPVLEVDGTIIPQSITISRFLANQFHLAGKDNLEQAKVDAVVDTVSDLYTAYLAIPGEPDLTKKEVVKKKFAADELPKHLKNLEVLGKLYGSGGPFFVGNNLTLADLFFYDIGQNMVNFDGTSLDQYPWLKQNRAEVEKQPRVAEYLKNRPKTPF